MNDLRIPAAAVLLACVALAGCGKYGPKGDRGLPPPPEGVAYPNINQTPSYAGGRPLKSREEQKRLEADLLARKRR